MAYKSNHFNYISDGVERPLSDKYKIVDDIVSRTSIINYALSRGYDLKKQGNEYKLRGMGGLIIDPANNRFSWFSGEKIKGGGLIQFIQAIEDCSWSDAVGEAGNFVGVDFNDLEYINTVLGNDEELLKEKYKTRVNEYDNRAINIIEESKREQKLNASFNIPEKEVKQNDINKMLAYFTKTRGLNKDIVYQMINENLIYKEKNKANCVFVGKNKDGEIKYIYKRSHWNDFTNNTGEKINAIKQEIKGSDKAYSFSLAGDNDTLNVCEGVFDVLSLLSIKKNENIDNIYDDSYIALGGVTNIGLNRFLEDYPNIKNINLILDNDHAGRQGTEAITNELSKKGYTVNNISPLMLGKDGDLINDLNDYLLNGKIGSSFIDFIKDGKVINPKDRFKIHGVDFFRYEIEEMIKNKEYVLYYREIFKVYKDKDKYKGKTIYKKTEKDAVPITKRGRFYTTDDLEYINNLTGNKCFSKEEILEYQKEKTNKYFLKHKKHQEEKGIFTKKLEEGLWFIDEKFYPIGDDLKKQGKEFENLGYTIKSYMDIENLMLINKISSNFDEKFFEEKTVIIYSYRDIGEIAEDFMRMANKSNFTYVKEGDLIKHGLMYGMYGIDGINEEGTWLIEANTIIPYSKELFDIRNEKRKSQENMFKTEVGTEEHIKSSTEYTEITKKYINELRNNIKNYLNRNEKEYEKDFSLNNSRELLTSLIEDVVEETDWSVGSTENYICFENSVGTGKDCSFDVDIGSDIDDVFNAIVDYASCFDVNYETYIQLDDNGKNRSTGADLITVYEDVLKEKEALEDLKEKLVLNFSNIKNKYKELSDTAINEKTVNELTDTPIRPRFKDENRINYNKGEDENEIS